MKVAYTSWTWIHCNNADEGKWQLKQSFKELKHIGYDVVENFAFISDFYKENPQELVEMTKEVGVELANLYGHFNFDIEGSLKTAMAQIDFWLPAVFLISTARMAALVMMAPSSVLPILKSWILPAKSATAWANMPSKRA